MLTNKLLNHINHIYIYSSSLTFTLYITLSYSLTSYFYIQLVTLYITLSYSLTPSVLCSVPEAILSTPALHVKIVCSVEQNAIPLPVSVIKPKNQKLNRRLRMV